MNKLVIVLGMHRSGTSAITRGLKALGVELGEHLLPPVAGDNDRGYWEDRDVNALNIELLAQLGQDWHSIAPLEPAAFEDESLEPLRRRAAELIREKAGGGAPFGLKDPRIARLLPFWNRVFEDVGVSPDYVIACRDPRSVALSLNRRAALASVKSHYLWLAHVVPAVLDSRGRPRMVVGFDRLLDAPEEQLRRMAAALGLPLPDASAVEEYTQSFLERSLRHSRFDPDDLAGDASVPAEVVEAYAWLNRLAADAIHPDAPELTEAFESLAARLRRLSPLFDYVTEQDRNVALLHGVVAARDADLEALRAAAADHERALGEAADRLAERDVQHARLQDDLAERDAQHARLQDHLAERDAQQARLRDELTTKDAQIAHLEASLADARAEAAGHAQRVTELTRTNAELERGLEAARTELGRVFGSWSWRLTGPLRTTNGRARVATARLRGATARTARDVWRRLPVRHKERLKSLAFRHGGRLFGHIPGHREGHLRAGEAAGGASPAGDALLHYRAPGAQTLAAARERVETLASRPRFSIVMPTYNTPPALLRAAVDSVLGQVYPDWELCVHDDASSDPATRAALEALAREHPRIRVRIGESNRNIAGASNAAAAMASGDYLVFLDHDDELHPFALLEFAAAIAASGADFLYSDEGYTAEDGRLQHVFCKPDWSPDLMLAQNYIGHAVALSRPLFERLGGFRMGFDGAQDYDLFLRASEQAEKIVHVPEVLYFWRAVASSTRHSPDAKPHAQGAGLRAVAAHCERVYGATARVEEAEKTFVYQVRFATPPESRVSILIPTRDRVELLAPCVQSILEHTRNPAFEIVILDNQSSDPETLWWFESMQRAEPRLRVIPADYPFNWSRINNHAAREARGDVLVFLNNDTLVISPDWLEVLAGNALAPGIGVVGPLLLYEDGSIQHAGVVVGMGGWADHVFKGERPEHRFCPYVSPVVRRNVSAVSGACLAVSRANFERIGGFDEQFIVCGSDVEFCLRALDMGLRVVFEPLARLYHLESKTRSPHDIPAVDFEMSKRAYERWWKSGDPYFNRQLSYRHTAPVLES